MVEIIHSSFRQLRSLKLAQQAANNKYAAYGSYDLPFILCLYPLTLTLFKK